MEITGINTILKIYQDERIEYWTRIPVINKNKSNTTILGIVF